MSFLSRLAVAITAGLVGLGAAPPLASAASDADPTGPTPGTYAPGRVLVKYAPGVDAATQRALESTTLASRLGSIDPLGVQILHVPEGAEQRVVDALSRSRQVAFAERDGVAQGSQTPNDPYFAQMWGASKVNLPAVWDTTQGSAQVVIAVLDTGVDGAHDDLRGRLTSGYDFVNNDADPTDDQGHGTATAGILGAAANNATGVAGTCWTCVLMPVKVLNANNWGPWSVISNGITYAADHGADIISMSIYGTTGSTTLQNAVAYARNKGVLVVVAAGNDGTATPSYPASYPGALAVAGSDSSDRLYSWSDYGSWVDVAAPGCAYTTQRSGGYWNFCGTSTATPIVAGVAGLMLAANPLATATQLEEALESSAVGIGSGVAYGRVDASRALAAVSTSGPAPAPTPTTSPTASPAPTPSASPSASPSAPATTQTFSGSLTNKSPSRAFQVTAGDGALQASLSSAKSATLTLQILDAAGKAVAQATGTSTVAVQSSVAAGTYTLVASSAQRTSFSLTATVPNP